MTWREAFLRQARSDDQVRRRLNVSEVPYSHRLHYLQMVCEKLAKALRSRPGDANPPATTHAGFVRMLQTLKGYPDVREALGYADADSFRAAIDSLLDLATQIERLAPSMAGQSLPNPEYPWWDAAGATVVAPADFSFPLFDPAAPRMIKLERLIVNLLRIV